MVANNGQANASPCIRQCCLDADDVCLGCFRSLPEIVKWLEVNDVERARFISNAERRRASRKRPIA
jgi:predicted Fe-S protein YdhL (DUF1289 family)